MAEALELFLVEDEEEVAFIMRSCLERAGHHVTVCRSGADALFVLSHRQFHLVLLDYRLEDEQNPEMNGLDLLRALHQERINTPVLIVTCRGDEEIAADVLRAGAVDYITKTSKTFLTELPKRVVESVTRHRLQQNNDLLIAALESARDGIFITDLQGEILHVNGALERMFGFDRAELIGNDVARLTGIGSDGPVVSPPSRDAPRDSHRDSHRNRSEPKPFTGEMWRILQGRNSWQGELVARRKDGTSLEASLTVSPIFDARGQMTHFVGIYRDIGERKQMERQLFQAQKMQSVGTLAGGVAHEFNNLLAGIQGYAALGLREPGLAPDLHEFLANIVQLSERAANLTRQLLAFARKPALTRQPAVIARMLTGTADLVRRSLNLDVALDLQEPTREGAPWMALADTNQLQQVLVNLCVNARDALRDALTQRPATPIAIRLRHRLVSVEMSAFPQSVPPGDYIVIEVEDRGSGMTAEVLNQALDPFFTTKDVGQGTGLGLPVAFGIMTGHQGFLTIDSRPNEGTLVRLYLPRLVDDKRPAPFEPMQLLEPETTPSRHILVIDNEEAVTDVIRRFLAIAGHDVMCVTSGELALEYLHHKPPVDLVILDLMIPREDGATNFRRIRESCPNLPILLCTGLVHGNDTTLPREPGVASLLHKPFRMNELWHAVNTCLRRRDPGHF
jgi:DNA-binding response OmpR family regulator/signal transduction histidine kinase